MMYITSQQSNLSQINTIQTRFEACFDSKRKSRNALSFRCTLMVLYLSRMRRNVNRNVYNDRENVSATPSQRRTSYNCCLSRAFCRLKTFVANVRVSKDLLKRLSFVVLTNATKVWPIL